MIILSANNEKIETFFFLFRIIRIIKWHINVKYVLNNFLHPALWIIIQKM